jgi:hypothetical protein
MSNRKAWLKVIYRLVAQRASGGFCHTSESINSLSYIEGAGLTEGERRGNIRTNLFILAVW